MPNIFNETGFVSKGYNEVRTELAESARIAFADKLGDTTLRVDDSSVLGRLFGINKSQIVVDTIIKEEIRKEPMVDSIKSFESQLVNYTYACKFSVYLKEEQKTITYYILTNENGLDITNENGDVLTLKL